MLYERSHIGRFISHRHLWCSMSETITTFDGVVHDKEEIIEKMYDDDFYYGYLGKQALSSSSLKKLLSSPNEYLRSLEEEDATESQPLRDGKLFHWNVLEPEKFEELRVIDVASKNTKAYKTAKAEFGEVYCRNEIEKAESLASVLKNNKPAMAFLENADFEVPQIDTVDGIPFRGKADIVQGTKIIDLKTTADLEGFNFAAYRFGYDLQAYLYLQLFPQAEEFIFVVIDKKTKDIGIFDCSEEFLESGKKKLEQGIENYKFFFEGDVELSQFVRYGTL